MKTKTIAALILLFFIHFQGKATLDIGVTMLLSPSFTTVTPGTTEDIMIIVENFGTTTVQNFDIRYSIDNGPEITIPYIGFGFFPMVPEIFYLTSYTFPCQTHHQFRFYTVLPGDIDPSNDTLNVTLTFSPPVHSDTISPQALPYWSGTVNSTGFVQNSMVQCLAGQTQYGWITFDVTGLAITSVIDSATLYLHATFPYQNPVFELVKLSTAPFNTTASATFQQFQNTIPLQTCTVPGSPGNFLAIPLNSQVLSLILSSTISGHFTLGFKEISPGTANVATFQGALQGEPPYIILHSAQPFAHDVGVSSVSTNPPGPIPTSPMMVDAIIGNNGMNSETVNVICTGPGGYTSTVTNFTLMPGTSSQITFPDLFNPPPGPFCLQVETQLPTDQNCLNDVDTLCYSMVLPTLVNGSVHYANTAFTPLYDSTFVHLVPMNPPGPVISDTVDQNGFFEFTNPAPGSYVLMASSSRHWKGVNATDAMKAMQHYVGMIQLTGLKAKAADVNGDGWINSLDALLIARRFVGQINSFPVGDWIFEDFQLQINTSQSLFQNIPGIIAGDTDGSY